MGAIGKVEVGTGDGMRWWGLAGLVLAVLAGSAAPNAVRGDTTAAEKGTVVAAPEPAPSRGLGGVWKLDLERSEPLKDKMPQTPEGGPPGGAGFPPGGGPGGRPPGGRSGGPRGGSMGGPADGGGGVMAAVMKELANPPLMMLIEDLDSLYILSERGETRQVLVLGDMALAKSTYPDAPHVAAKWKGKALVSESVGPRGGSFRTEYRLSGDGATLVVQQSLEGPGGRGGIDLERVYVRYEGDD